MEFEKRKIKYLFHFFNFIFVLCGLAYLIIGVLALIGYYYYLKNLDNNISNVILQIPIMYIVIGSIIVFIAFLGYYGAIRENHYMIVTFAALLLTILIIQVIVAIYIFIVNNSEEISYEEYTMLFYNYSKDGRKIVDFIQEMYECCGIDGPDDFARLLHIPIPRSCCDKSTNDTCDQMHSYKTGCVDALEKVESPGNIPLVVISIGTELIGIICAVCLTNSIKNANRRGHVV